MCSQDSTDVYQNHNYVNSLDSYFNIRDEDRQMSNYFIYENIEDNDLMDLLLDVYHLSRSMISDDVVIGLRLVDGDMYYENPLGIYIQLDIEDVDNFFPFRQELFQRHELEVLYKIYVFMW